MVLLIGQLSFLSLSTLTIMNNRILSFDSMLQLLEMLMNNCGENTHRLVIDSGLLPILVKIVKKKVECFFFSASFNGSLIQAITYALYFAVMV